MVEITDATPYAELLAYEALWSVLRGGIGRRGWPTDGSRAAGACRSICPVACMTFNPVFCTGLIRIAEIANQVRGRAGPHQMPERARCGLAHAGSGFAMQYQAAIVLAASRERGMSSRQAH